MGAITKTFFQNVSNRQSTRKIAHAKEQEHGQEQGQEHGQEPYQENEHRKEQEEDVSNVANTPNQ